MSTTHGYFVDKARTVFTNAKGDPELSYLLASWAEAAHATGDSRVGVIVTEDGRILATTRHTPATASSPGATYVTDVADGASHESVINLELGLALGSLRRLTGKRLIHVKYSEVCQGAGVRA